LVGVVEKKRDTLSLTLSLVRERGEGREKGAQPCAPT
jgi:hypothetical protein